jgi:hypothetical protein
MAAMKNFPLYADPQDDMMFRLLCTAILPEELSDGLPSQRDPGDSRLPGHQSGRV